jgi:hypothetical protein
MADKDVPPEGSEPWMQFANQQAQIEAEALAAQCASAIATMATGFQPIREAAVGYRQSLLGSGFTEQGAEACALEFHSFLVAQLRSAIQA